MYKLFSAVLSGLFAADEGQTDPLTIGLLVLLGLVLVVVLFVMPRLRGKKNQETTNTVHSLLLPGAYVKTIGGIVGKVVEVKGTTQKDKQMILEVGEQPNTIKMTFDIAALYTIVTLATGEKFDVSMLRQQPKVETKAEDKPEPTKDAFETTKADTTTESEMVDKPEDKDQETEVEKDKLVK
ncbi:MAG: preprotein translocase subunit YajC [Firmicutes bacterium]|nr:preprotein translocase subunit YajC [Bacillota bacterium]